LEGWRGKSELSLRARYTVSCREVSRGWYWGSEQLREFLLKKVEAAAIRRNRNYQSTQMGPDHAQAEAERIVQEGLQRSGRSESDLRSLPGSDPRKVAIAVTIHKSEGERSQN
jgi:hypothetical protein